MQRTAAVAAVDEFISSDSRILVLAGGVGTGKSVAGAYAIWRKRGLFIHASKLGAIGAFDADDREMMRRVESSPLLVVDDVGSGTDTKGRIDAMIDAMIVCRFDKGLATLITTNRSAEIFKQGAGERVVDRIRGGGRFILLGGRIDAPKTKDGGNAVIAIPDELVAEVNEVLEIGASKHGPQSYRLRDDVEDCNKLLGHFDKWQSGEKTRGRKSLSSSRPRDRACGIVVEARERDGSLVAACRTLLARMESQRLVRLTFALALVSCAS